MRSTVHPDPPVVEVERPEPGVVRITLSRPDRLNALDRRLVTELDTALTAADADPACRVVILTGAGRGFCAGLDLDGFETPGGGDTAPGEGPIERLARQRDIARLAVRIHELRPPVVAAVNGPAAGGGLALALASDIRVASTSAVFAVGFLRAGYSACDIGISWLLPRIVGTGRAHELMLTGRRADAAEALRIGLVTDVVAPEELTDTAAATARAILASPPFSVELTKQGMWAGVENPGFAAAVEFENRQQVLTALTDDAREATRAFLDKRPPTYRRR
ncbi:MULTISPECIES: enoyl-CoA hydratase/isomerase family protein [unclassified Pseudonocardia]|uniref:enoyl-CoA hydratase/isomerase family protein n=1 Tax=unclassified Pseudonocardia TaxID=2619320 RepID=UPI001CF6D78B|nr:MULTISPECIES: enoyl-CoA hydratase/isomerase family protein [unclassified Pseudonocardia]